MSVRAYAGEYDQRVTIWRNVPTVNSDGQKVEVATEYIRRKVSVRPLSGKERFLAQQTQADVTHRVRMRRDNQTKAITPKDWLSLRDGTRLDVTRVFDVDMARRELELECKQRV